MKRWFKEMMVLGLAAVLALFFVITPGETEAKEKGEFIVTANPSIGNLDPASSGTGANVMVYRCIFQSLLRYKFNYSTELEGDLAKSWSLSKDGLVYTFKLRDNVKWHKGFGKVTAEDVKFTFDRIMDPKTRSASLGDLAGVKEVKVVDDLTVEIYLKERDLSFLNKCVVKPLGIVCKKAVEQYGMDFGRNPIGSGPFVFESMSREEVVLTANKEYYEGPSKFEKVIYKAISDGDTQVLGLIKGEIDLISGILLEKTTYDRIKAGGSIAKGIDNGQSYLLLLNPKFKPLADVRVRRAIAHAIDKEEIVNHLFIPGAAENMLSPVTKGYWGYTEEGLRRYNFDLKKAKELLAEAGYPNGFEITMDTPSLNTYLPIATAVQGQLAKAGIKVKLDVSDEPSWDKKRSGAIAQMTIYNQARIPDADGPLTNLFHSASFPPGRNMARYDKLDKEIEEARGELNPSKRLKMYQEIQKKLMEDLPLIPLVKNIRGVAYRANVAGVPDRDPVYGPDIYRLYFKE